MLNLKELSYKICIFPFAGICFKANDDNAQSPVLKPYLISKNNMSRNIISQNDMLSSKPISMLCAPNL